MNLKQTAWAQSRRTFFKLSGLVLGSAMGGWGLSRVSAQATPPPTPALTPTAIDAEVTPISAPALTPTVIEPDVTATAIEAQITPIVTPETTSTAAATAPATSIAAPTVQTTLTPTATGTEVPVTPAATGTAPAAGTAGPGFVLPPLPYDYGALEPVIDTTTMTLHHDRHHAAYVTELNTLLSNAPNVLALPPETLVRNLNRVPRAIRLRVRNNVGGHLNHSWFWQMMRPPSSAASGNTPSGALADAINRSFGSFEAFKTTFETAGVERFGSGWVWLVRDRRGRLGILSTPNQDNPLMAEYGGLTPILGNDVWEHAYYLKYQNKRRDYLTAWWQVVNWDFAAQRFAA